MFAAGATILVVVIWLAVIPVTRNAINRSRALIRIMGCAIMASLALMAGSFITLLWRFMP